MEVPKKKYTIKDIAKKFKCSPSTVSRALNNHHSINPDTRKNIQEYANTIGYRKNEMALNFLNGRTFTVGVIVPTITPYFFASIINGIQKILDPLGYALTIFQTNETHGSEVNFIEKLINNNADGIFVSVSSETRTYDHFDKVVQRNIPLILFDRECEYPSHKVSIDNKLSSKIAVQHLIDMGCKRIAHLKGPEALDVTQSRLNGYIEALLENGLPLRNEYIISAGFKAIKGVFPMSKLLRLPEIPDGVFAANDKIAAAAMHTIRSHNLRIPEDIAIVGFDDEPITAYFNPSLTTIHQPTLDLGEEIAHVFLNHLNSKDYSYPQQNIVLPTELIIRNSTLRKIASMK